MSAITDHRLFRPDAPEGAIADFVTVAPGGGRIGYSLQGERDGGIYAIHAGAPANAARLVECNGWRPEALGWSPDSGHVAYVVGGRRPGVPPEVGWAGADGGGELGRAPGAAFAWTPKGNALFIADTAQKALVRLSLATGKAQVIAALDDDGDPFFRPRIAVSPDGTRVAFTCGRARDGVSEVWIAERKGNDLAASLLTQIPGAEVEVLPFWSPKGSLAFLAVHHEQEKSAIIGVTREGGEGAVLYASDRCEPGEAPAFSPSGQHIAFLRATPAEGDALEGPPELVLLDFRKSAATAVTAPGAVLGAPHFIDDTRLAIDGGEAAHILTFASTP